MFRMAAERKTTDPAGERVAEATRQRAAVYAHLYRVLKEELGRERAFDLMGKAIHAHGAEMASRTFSPAALGGDLAAAAAEFASPDPVKQHQFAPKVLACSAEEALLEMTGCPLVEQWRSMGLDAGEVSELCAVARRVDHGAWEGALGFSLSFEGTLADGNPACLLRVRKVRKV
jgi:hypothetical protein